MSGELHTAREAAAEAQRIARLTQEDVAENTVPKLTIQQRWKAEEEALAKARRRVRNMLIGVGVLAVLAPVLSFVASYLVSDAKLSQYKDQRLAACNDRNNEQIAQQKKSAEFFAPLLAKEKAEPHPDPVLIITLTAIEHTPPTLTNCVGK
jgi:hypothetical protein